MTSASPSGPRPATGARLLTDQKSTVEEEDEEDDEDFNPLSHQTLSPEASSSLSSENEHSAQPKSQPPVPINPPQNQRPTSPAIEDEEETETVMQTKESSLGQATKTTVEHRDGDGTEDAICRRTRARYSLANSTLDELETFLQETDDEDDFYNAGDEEEYRKFLTAVLNGDADGSGGPEGNGSTCVVGDDDEENDADFEIEIEEALESDGGGGERQPETRQKRRRKASARSKKKNKKFLGQANVPLRPLLPSVSNGQVLPALHPPLLPFNAFERCPRLLQPDQMMGFTAAQIGELYCLIHEHVQLLIQVYSLSVLDQSRQHVANGVEKLILEMSHTRNEALAWRKIPYPDVCFQPPYVHTSVFDNLPQSRGTQLDSMGPHRSSEGSIWMPVINGPVRSVLDVSPLSLVRRYVADVSMAVEVHKQCHVEAVYSSTHFEKEPLFPLPSLSPSVEEANNEALKEAAPTDQAQKPKKTLAALLVESTKQSVALVPKDIVKLARRFFPLFNSALFPHKPPQASLANRVLFTDAEDELLAMGLMEYNNDWKAIQQRFLPCKSKHQIFVRQKNRNSSKAPENPIKAVRRMKTSPLTAEEKARIHEGLKVLKLDWMSVWKFFVPHRDPSLLPRQWRIALGTQRSYKTSDSVKEKRRLYLSKKRKIKKALSGWQSTSEKEVDNADGGDNSAEGNMDDEDEAYVHEAFLADWKPGSSRPMSSELPLSNFSSTLLQSGGTLAQVGSHGGEKWTGIMNEYEGSGSMHEYEAASESPGDQQNASCFNNVRYSASHTVGSGQMTSDCKLKPFRPYRMRKSNAAQLVKLAPDLPPVNLPPSVRVISQSALKSSNCESPISKHHGCETENPVLRSPHVVRSSAPSMTAVKSRNVLPKNSTENHSQKDPRTSPNQLVTEEGVPESDLQMHPLLLQAPDDGRVPYFPANENANGSNTFSFFPGNPFQANLKPFSKSQHVGSTLDCFHPALRSKETPSDLCTIDFHPLLQRSDNVDSDPVIGSSVAHMSGDSESLQGSSARISNSSNPIPISQVIDDQWATNTAPSSPYEKANELDLDIHLSTSTSKENIKGSRGMTEHDLSGPTTSALDDRNIEERQQSNIQSYHNGENCSSASFAANSCVNAAGIGKTGSQTKASNDTHAIAHEMALSGNSISRYGEDNQCEQSLQEIVMEQEELSDSDEDIGEDVEFECEEMADSEGEELDCEQLADIQIKVGSTMTANGEKIVASQDHDRQRTCDPQSNVCIAKSNTRSRKLGSTEKQKNAVSFSSETCTPGSSGSKSKLERRNQDDQDLSNGLGSRPSRLSKRKPKTEGATARPRESPLPHLSSAAAEHDGILLVKKPRKRVCRTNPKTTMNKNTVCSDPLPSAKTKEGTKLEPDTVCSEPLPSAKTKEGTKLEPDGIP
ncbi:uncharacterized protein LOC131257997 isoform X2 [Magnolia sinica]|uniref:uncharacterized protein LOC131257997 isoform X2 n=1 Tax=Magnolia sinica TaxID=86752 RepID=UPI00265B03E2|nr:uncharacterized protein LOC131257997 isoform X2 [Magnolia sinica]